VRLSSGSTAAQEEAVISSLRERLEANEQVTYKLERATYFSFRTPIEVEIFSDSLEDLHAAAAAVESEMQDLRGLVDVRASTELGNPEVQVRFKREQLARLGLDLSSAAATIRAKIQGEVATRFTEGDREIDIRVRALDAEQAAVDDIDELIVGHVEGRPIFLKSVADITITEGPTEIRRIGQRRAALVSGNLDNRDMGAAAADVRTALLSLAPQLPPTVTAKLTGQEEELKRSFSSLALAMALAIFLVYLVMASQFESFLHPFVIIFSLPLGAVGVVAALALTGHTVNVVAIIGAVMLAGIVVNNAIVLIDAVNQRRRAGMSVVDALKDAGRNRLRPILMTTATTVFGLAPMALGMGEAAELRAPLAITVIGGLSVATVLTLLVIPVVYSFFCRGAMADLAIPEHEPEAAAKQDPSKGSTPTPETGLAAGGSR
jgi:HAE1 family hydrophobic/amphiphilic exporter-1